MSTENLIADSDDVNLDDFSADFFGQKKVDEVKQEELAKPSEEEVDAEEDTDALTDTQENEDDDTLESEDDKEDTDEDEEEDTPTKPVKKKSRLQERIDELTAGRHEAERRANALEAKLNELISNQNKIQKEEVAKTKSTSVDDGDMPSPDDLNEDGSDKYPLGNYDPNYIKDLTKYAIESEHKAAKERQEQEAVEQAKQNYERDLVNSWLEKLEAAKETYPDIIESNNRLENTFKDIEPNYGKYLAATIMSMDYGTDVLYYLSNNLEEAQKIVQSGATKATMALGRLEDRFASAAQEKQKARPKVSKAPPPPPSNKGSAAAIAEVPDDTTDLEAFSKKFFKKKA